VLSLIGLAAAAGEWLRAPSRGVALAALVLALLTIALKRRVALLVPLAVLAIALAAGQLRLERLANRWPDEREARIESASARLSDELRDARLLADTLARRGLDAARLPTEAGFRSIAGLVRGTALEAGAAVFEATAEPRIWSGRFRLLPSAAGDSVDVRLTPFYAVLEVRRHDTAGRTAVGVVLLAAHQAVPDQERSLAAQFQQRTEVGLRILPADQAPNTTDVFDYELPVSGGSRVLFSAQLVPPEQPNAVARAERAAGRQVALALLITLVLALWLVPAGIARITLALLPLLLALRSPIGAHLGIPQPFDASYFSSTMLGPVSHSAGPLALVGVVLLLTGALLWERGPTRRWTGVLAGIMLLAGAPYLLAELGRGIMPPASGVSMGLWLVWHLTLFLFSAGLMTLAAALLRGRELPQRGWWPPLLGAGLAVVAAGIGVMVWNARYGWPDWYTLLWLPPLVLVTRPANRRAAILGIGIVAGSATALLAWGAEVEGRLRAARADMVALGDNPDPAAESALRALGDDLAKVEVPRSAPELYALWRNSALSRAGRPVELGVWQSDGTPSIELKLDQLDLPLDLVAEKVRSLPPDEAIRVEALRREPAAHYLLTVRRDTAVVLTVAIGPKSALVPPSRMGRLLAADPSGSPLYRLTLSPAPSSRTAEPGLALWNRQGWQAMGQHTVTIGGIARDVFGTVELGQPGGLAVRGALVITLDVAVLTGLWWLAALLGGLGPIRPTWVPRLRSYQARLGAALAVFFLAPTVGFAAWGLGRLRTEIRESQDRMIDQSLRDVISPGTSLPADTAALSRELHDLGERLDAAFLLYRNGEQLAGSTGGLLEALGLVSPLMDPEAFYGGAFHGEASAAGPSRVVESRIGYRAVRLSDQSAAALAMSLVAADPVLSERQRDLALLLLLVTLTGVAASLLAARVAARVLARPVADLQHAALAFGRGEPAVMPELRPPLEFAPVFAAFEKMTEDVRRARDAQERVARIVAWGQMANQVAHEIKNPLTPMRLGVQHLRRVYQDGKPIGAVLEDTTQRILSEIDRLDRIARSFSRFGAPASDRGPLEAVSLPRIAREVADLYRLGAEGAEITVDAEQGTVAQARADEVRETLVNLLENARNAQASHIQVRIIGTIAEVEDDGGGIPPDLLPMIFEPRWSTSTSGSGLGLPIVKRLVEGWGGRVEVESEIGRGTLVRIIMLPGPGGGPGPALEGTGSPAKAE